MSPEEKCRRWWAAVKGAVGAVFAYASVVAFTVLLHFLSHGDWAL